MSKIPTAEKLWHDGYMNDVPVTVLMIEFAKLHVEEFRKECLKNVKTRTKKIHIPNSGGGYFTEDVVDRKTIRKAYPLTNIK